MSRKFGNISILARPGGTEQELLRAVQDARLEAEEVARQGVLEAVRRTEDAVSARARRPRSRRRDQEPAAQAQVGNQRHRALSPPDEETETHQGKAGCVPLLHQQSREGMPRRHPQGLSAPRRPFGDVPCRWRRGGRHRPPTQASAQTFKENEKCPVFDERKVTTSVEWCPYYLTNRGRHNRDEIKPEMGISTVTAGAHYLSSAADQRSVISKNFRKTRAVSRPSSRQLAGVTTAPLAFANGTS